MADQLMNYLSKKYNNSNDEYLNEPSTYEKREAKNKIRADLPDLQITKVRVVQNNYLRGMYELKKLEYKSRYDSVREKQMIHATSAWRVDSIIKNNFDWRLVNRSKYGKGTSFSPDADYANYHSNSSNGSQRAFIIADVLVSNKVNGSSLMQIPPSNADTSISTSGKVYVKYCDNEFFPKYVVYYNAPDRTDSKHHRHFRRHWFL